MDEKCYQWCPTRFSRWLVGLVFGKSEGISEDIENNTDEAAFIEGKKISPIEVNIFAMIILCFTLLMFIAAYGAYLLEVTHTCSEDPAIHCFPRFIDKNDPQNPNLTRDEMMEMTKPINDCSLWVNSSIAPLITFQCFRFAFNIEAAMATAGGLLALFTVAVRITISIFLKLFKWSRKIGCSERLLGALQVLAVVLLLPINVGTAVVLSFQLNSQWGSMEDETTPAAQRTASYLADNGLQFLVIMGTAALLLLIQWSRYTRDESQQERGDHELRTVQ